MKHRIFFHFCPLLILALFLCACGDDSNPSSTTPSQTGVSRNPSSSSSPATSDIEDPEAPSSSGSRDNTPVIYIGKADGITTYENDLVTLDASHTEDGYFMVLYHGSNKKVKLQLTGPDAVTYTYNLHDGYETFPLTAGNGTYSLGVYENIEGTSYASVFSQTLDVTLTNEFGPFLYSSQYVNFNENSKPIQKAMELASNADTDLDVVENVYNYIIQNFSYDYDKASSVQSGYLPDVDAVYDAKTGICFDYAAIMATMLRTQNIPTRLEIGYMGDVYHAWISVYTKEAGWINGIIRFDGSKWSLMDPTFASTSSSPKDFLAESGEYLTKYVY
ncbi:MAG: transglutaminase family protein [Roseburia sp.]